MRIKLKDIADMHICYYEYDSIDQLKEKCQPSKIF